MRGRVRIVAVVVEGGVALAPREGEGGIEAGARRVRCVLGCGRGFALSLSTAGVCRVWGTKRQERVGHACAPHAHPPSKKVAPETVLHLLRGPKQPHPWMHRGGCPAAGQESAATCGDDGSPPRTSTFTVQLGSARAWGGAMGACLRAAGARKEPGAAV
ncbi:hypothetical protein B0H13DRAFT_2087264, partial [Mycena leptocephala]